MTVPPGAKAHQLLEHFQALHHELTKFVASCSNDVWQCQTLNEGWPVSSTAYHIGTAHYARTAWVNMIANGQSPPTITFEEIDRINNEDAHKSAKQTQAEIITFLQNEADAVTNTLAALSDAQLARKMHLDIIGGEISASHLFTAMVVDAAYPHLESMQTVTSNKRRPK